MYKLINIDAVQSIHNNLCIPFDASNVEFRHFITNVINGSELRDIDDNIMSKTDINNFFLDLANKGLVSSEEISRLFT